MFADVSQGHVRVGPSTVTDPAHHITRSMEDFVTWVDTSKIKRKVCVRVPRNNPRSGCTNLT